MLDARQCPVQGLYDAVRRKAYRKRTDGRLTWTLGPGVELAVAVYVLLKRARPGGGVAYHAVTNEEMTVESANICQDTGAPVGARLVLPNGAPTRCICTVGSPHLLGTPVCRAG